MVSVKGSDVNTINCITCGVVVICRRKNKKYCVSCCAKRELSSYKKYNAKRWFEQQKLYQHEWYKKNRKKKLEMSHQYYQKHKTEYAIQHRLYRLRNKAKLKRIAKRWYKQNPEKVLARRLRLRANLNECYGSVDWKDLFLLQLLYPACAYCGSNGKLTVDHIIPMSRGGMHDLSNLVMCCKPCNSSKNNRLMNEWKGRGNYG